MVRFHIAPPLVVLLLSISCNGKEPAAKEVVPAAQGASLFTKVAAERSGITFRNTISETPTLNYLTYNNLFSGGGLAVGDLNNDDLPDLYFTGNQVSDRLYLNKGGLVFEDVTRQAISSGLDGWHRGATIVDVDADGWNDIYVCRHGWQTDPALRANLLYINNHDGTFTEKAAEWGLADTSHSTHATFFDHDRDGDLDVLVLNQPPERAADVRPLSLQEVMAIVKSGKAETSRLYRNEGSHFSDVTTEAGLVGYAFALGSVILDADNNGWPDLYVANDYAEPDRLYINNGKGGFTDEVKERTGHVSNFGMGVDAGDINNDGAIDLVVLDMAYKSMVRAKENMGAMRPSKFWGYINAGYHYQYMINTMQLNNGNGSFSEVAQMTGVAKSDWSWAPLIEDLDNDGWNDLYVTNGTDRDVRNNDAVLKLQALYERTGGKADIIEALGLMPATPVSNVCYRNSGITADGLQFTDITTEWGLYEPNTSHGLVAADLDRDGDLDLVMNRTDAVSSVFENHQNERGDSHYLRVKLQGPVKNRAGIGATVRVHHTGQQLTRTVQLGRGYQSAQEPIAHFGLGAGNGSASVEVEWPDGKWSRIEGVAADQVIEVPWSSALDNKPDRPEEAPLFTSMVMPTWARLAGPESDHDDFLDEILLPQRYSRMGPFVSVGDVNGDGLDDLVHSGPAGKATQVMRGSSGTGFVDVTSPDLLKASAAEDLGSALFDADGDHDLDLIIVSGSKEFSSGDQLFRPRFHTNDGTGRFTYRPDAIPDILVFGQRVATGDIDGDGDLDLFIGGRAEPGRYPLSPRSYLLVNTGGKFTDATASLAPELMSMGMITDARFADMDGDKDNDLVIVGEWMSVTILSNDAGSFSSGSNTLPGTEGWWYSVEVEDLDGDGDMDIVAGNLGLNSKYHASDEAPFHVYMNDFDGSGTYDIVLAMHQNEALFPVRGRQCSSEQMPFIKEKFPTYQAFANATVEHIYSPQALNEAFHRKATELRSCVFRNNGNGTFAKQALPMRAQAAPINDILIRDLDGDGRKDLIVAGNNYDTEVETVRYDAGTGLVLLQGEQGALHALTPAESGLYLPGNVKDLSWLTLDGRTCVVATNNGSAPSLFVLGPRSVP